MAIKKLCDWTKEIKEKSCVKTDSAKEKNGTIEEKAEKPKELQDENGNLVEKKKEWSSSYRGSISLNICP